MILGSFRVWTFAMMSQVVVVWKLMRGMLVAMGTDLGSTLTDWEKVNAPIYF
jgi:hypothetical protein